MVTDNVGSGRIYEVDFEIGSPRLSDGVFPDMDGMVVLKEAPPVGYDCERMEGEGGSRSWTESGVDVSIQMCSESMERLLIDPLLLPRRM